MHFSVISYDIMMYGVAALVAVFSAQLRRRHRIYCTMHCNYGSDVS